MSAVERAAEVIAREYGAGNDDEGRQAMWAAEALAEAGMLVTDEMRAVLDAAAEWRRYVSVASPKGHRPPPRSTRLAEAVDAYLESRPS